MDNHEILQHLLDLDVQAADLVNDAQTEANNRIFEGENQNCARYEEVYAREVKTLEESCVKELVEIKENYQKQLEVYRESLKAMPMNMSAFSSLAEKFLSTALPCKEP